MLSCIFIWTWRPYTEHTWCWLRLKYSQEYGVCVNFSMYCIACVRMCTSVSVCMRKDVCIDVYVHTYVRSWLLTQWSRVLLEKLTGFQPVKKFPTYYGARRFITAFRSARHQSLSRASSIQSIPPHSTSWRSIGDNCIFISQLCSSSLMQLLKKPEHYSIFGLSFRRLQASYGIKCRFKCGAEGWAKDGRYIHLVFLSVDKYKFPLCWMGKRLVPLQYMRPKWVPNTLGYSWVTLPQSYK